MRLVSQLTRGTIAIFTSIGPVMIHWMVSISVCRAEIIRGMAKFIMLIVRPIQSVPETTAAVTNHLLGSSRSFTVQLYAPIIAAEAVSILSTTESIPPIDGGHGIQLTVYA